MCKFPKYHFHQAVEFLCPGFMTTHELKLFESLHSDFNKYWMPLTWFSNLAARAREEGRVRDDIALRLLMDVSEHDYLESGNKRHGWKMSNIII